MNDPPSEASSLTAQEKQQIFAVLNEIGIINQLSSSLLNRTLPEGLHVSHFSILNHLMRLGDGRTPLAIANAFQVTKGTMTHSLKVLEKRGFISLETNPEDSRSKLVFLTAPGRLFHGECISTVDVLGEKLMPHLDIKALQEMLPALSHLRSVLDENRDI